MTMERRAMTMERRAMTMERRAMAGKVGWAMIPVRVNVLYAAMMSRPPMYGRNTSGTTIDPSACW
jgi:hypothetical protein